MSKNKKDKFNQEATPQPDQLLPENTIVDNEDNAATTILPETENPGEAATETVQLESLSPANEENNPIALDEPADTALEDSEAVQSLNQPGETVPPSSDSSPEATPAESATIKTPKVKAAKAKLEHIRKSVSWKGALALSLCAVAAFGVGVLGGISLHHDHPTPPSAQEAQAPHDPGFGPGQRPGHAPACQDEDCLEELKDNAGDRDADGKGPRGKANAKDSQSSSDTKKNNTDSSTSQDSTAKDSTKTQENTTSGNNGTAEKLNQQYQELEKRLAELEKQSKTTNQ